MAKLSLKGAALESFVLTVTDGCMTTCQKMICSFPMVAQVTFSVQGLTKKQCRTKFQIFSILQYCDQCETNGSCYHKSVRCHTHGGFNLTIQNCVGCVLLAD